MSGPMNILFRCDATAETALGHLKRCRSLAAAITCADANSQVCFVSTDDSIVRQNLEDFGGDAIYVRNQINSYSDIADTIDIARARNTHMIVVDSYKANANYFENLIAAGFHTVYFEDLSDTDCRADTVINGAIDALDLAYRSPHQLLGLDYLVLAPDYWNVRSKPSWGTGTKHILITMGGIDHYDLSSRLITILSSFTDELRIHVVIGQYYENISNIEDAVRRCGHKVIIYENLDSLSPVMNKCHFAVSAGGMTLYELAAHGIATIGICLWENQRHNVESLGRAGLCSPLAYIQEASFTEQLGVALQCLFENTDFQQKTNTLGPSLVDGQGAIRSAQELFRVET